MRSCSHLPRFARRAVADQHGYTLPELLVVVIIIGVLAAIALPQFLGKTDRARDAAAMSNARNMVGAIEACKADKKDYTDCDSESKLTGAGTEPTGLPYGSDDGEVELQKVKDDSYEVVAHSSSGNAFTISRAPNGQSDRTCKKKSTGACPDTGTW